MVEPLGMTQQLQIVPYGGGPAVPAKQRQCWKRRGGVCVCVCVDVMRNARCVRCTTGATLAVVNCKRNDVLAFARAFRLRY